MLYIVTYKNWILGIWGISTTILSLYWTIYPIDQNAHLTFYQKSITDAFSIDQPINELQIIINGQDIGKSNLNLKVYRFRLENDGKADLIIEDYVKEATFGFHVMNGKIARIKFLQSLEFNQKLFNQLSGDSSKAIFNPIFLGKDKGVSFDIWVIHRKSIIPSILPVGKIANVGIDLKDDRAGHRSYWEEQKDEIKSFGRLILTEILPGLVVLILLFYLFDILRHSFKKRQIKKVYGLDFNSTNKAQKGIIEIYSDINKSAFEAFLKLILDSDRMNILLNEIDDIDKRINTIQESYNDHQLVINFEYISDAVDAIENLVSMGLATKFPEKGEIEIAPEVIEQARIVLKAIQNT